MALWELAVDPLGLGSIQDLEDPNFRLGSRIESEQIVAIRKLFDFAAFVFSHCLLKMPGNRFHKRMSF